MRNRMYGGVRGRKTKVGGNLLLFSSYSILTINDYLLMISQAAIPLLIASSFIGIRWW